MKNKKNFGKDFLSSEEESLIFRYEEMLAQGRSGYFDVSECEEIIDYYGDRQEIKKALQAVELAEKLHPQSPSIQLIKASLYAFDNKPRKALDIISRLEQSEAAYEIDMFRLKISKIFALILVGKIKPALALQRELLDSGALDSTEAEQVLIIATNGLLEKGEFEEVIRILQSFEDKIQRSSILLGYMGYAFAELAELDKAEACYRKGVAQNPFDPALWCDLADLLDNADEAIAAYDYALLLDEKFVAAYCGKAELLGELGRTEEAEKLLLKGAEICPYDTDIYDMLVDHYEEKQDYESAIACCRKMITEDPRHPSGWLALASMYTHIEKYDDALEACDTAMRLDDDIVVSVCEVKASIYMAMGLPEKELEMHLTMLQHDVHDVAMVHEIGALYESRDEYDVAYRIYAAALVVNPKEASLFAKLAFVMDVMDESDMAYRYALCAVELDEQSSFAWTLLASLEGRWGKQKKMLTSLKNALTCKKECCIGAFVMLYEAVVRNKIPKALSLVEHAENASVEHPVIHCYMAALFFSLSDIPKCLSWLEKALELDVEDSLRLFFKLCPDAKKNSAVKKLRSEYLKANKNQ
ncbi:MAG: tetratricopeptide repeat protein [Prevotellaceae bacterium]|nr:tetratricopeptide repeat protein [Prevotellaceae bacterium]